jgi:hypothetical protein
MITGYHDIGLRKNELLAKFFGYPSRESSVIPMVLRVIMN